MANPMEGKQPAITVENPFWIPNPLPGGIATTYITPTDYNTASYYVDPAIDDLTTTGTFPMTRMQPGGSYQFGDGTATAPSISFASDTDTGFYKIATGEIDFTVDGVKRGAFSVYGLLLVRADTSTTITSITMNQTSTGDTFNVWTLGAGNSFATGIDNSDSDKWKLSYGAAGDAALGTNDYITITVAGVTTLVTLNLTNPLALAYGGTNAALTASNGGIFYSTATAGAILTATATALQMLQSGASGAPAWSTTTWPATTTVSRILYSSSTNVIGEITTANSGLLVTSAGGVPSISTDIPTAVTIGTAYIYRVGGTDVSIADGGTNSSAALSNGRFMVSTAGAIIEAAQQTGGQNVTNSVTDTASTAGTIPDITNGVTYATDYTNLRNALYQLARMLKQDHDALRLYGLLT